MSRKPMKNCMARLTVDYPPVLTRSGYQVSAKKPTVIVVCGLYDIYTADRLCSGYAPGRHDRECRFYGCGRCRNREMQENALCNGVLDILEASLKADGKTKKGAKK